MAAATFTSQSPAFATFSRSSLTTHCLPDLWRSPAAFGAGPVITTAPQYCRQHDEKSRDFLV